MRRSIRLALSLIAATGLLLLAACSTHRTVEQKAKADPDWWLDTMHDAYEHYVDAVERSCPPQGLLSNDKCVKAKIIETFAKQNNAGTHCRTDEPSGAVLLCADLFTAIERIYVTLGLDPQQFIDWGDPYDSMSSLEQLLAARLTSKCPDAAQKDCATREVADLFAISATEAGRCIVTSDIKKQLSCATGIIRIEGYKTALRDAA